MSAAKPRKTKGKTDWEKLRASKKASSAPSERERRVAREVWAGADVVIPGGKTRMTVRFDTDLVEWFKSHGPKYQTRMNAVLRQFMSSHEETRASGDEAHITASERSKSGGYSVAEGMPDHSAAGYLEALNQLGKICMQQGDYESASRHFQEAVKFYRRATGLDQPSRG